MKKLISTIIIVFCTGLILSAQTNKFTYPLYMGKVGIATGKTYYWGITSGLLEVRVNAAAGTGTIWEYPSTNGTNNYFLKTNGSGVTSWSMIPQASVTGLADSLLNHHTKVQVNSLLSTKQNTLTTGNLTESITGLEFNNTRTVIGGAAALSLTSGYTIPTTTELASKKIYHGIQTAGTLSFNNTTHVLTVASGTNTYWYKGAIYTIASDITSDLDLTTDRDHVSATLTANTLYYFYFKDATGKLYWSPTSWNLDDMVPVATVYWNGSAGAIMNEKHNHTRDIDWHKNAHTTIGSRITPSDFAKTNPSTGTPASISIAGGTVWDEDIANALSAITTARIYYPVSASKYTFEDVTTPYLWSGAAVQYIRTSDYSKQVVNSNAYTIIWAYVSSDISNRLILLIQNQDAGNTYLTATAARAVIPPTLDQIGITAEVKLIYRFIYQGDGAYNTSTSDDFRATASLPYGGATSPSASSVLFASTSGISAGNVQAAIEELDAEKSPIPVDDILDWSTNKYTPYTAQTTGKFDVSTTNPLGTTRLNYDGYLYATKVFSGATEVVRSATSALLGVSISSGDIALGPWTSANKGNGRLYEGTIKPTNTTRLNYDGEFYATKIGTDSLKATDGSSSAGTGLYLKGGDGSTGQIGGPVYIEPGRNRSGSGYDIINIGRSTNSQGSYSMLQVRNSNANAAFWFVNKGAASFIFEPQSNIRHYFGATEFSLNATNNYKIEISTNSGDLAGKNLTINAGNSDQTTASNLNGGDIVLGAGDGINTGLDGNLYLKTTGGSAYVKDKTTETEVLYYNSTSGLVSKGVAGSSGGVTDVTSGGTGRATGATAYGLIAAGTTATGAHQTVATGAAGDVLTSGGASALPGFVTPTAASSINFTSYDYVIEKIASTYYAKPSGSYTAYSGSDAYTVIQAAITALGNLGSIYIKAGDYTLTDQLVITGLGSGYYPWRSLVITGNGFTTKLIQETTGKHGIVIKNRAGVNISNLYISCDADAGSAMVLDSTGTASEISVYQSSFDYLYLSSANASYPALRAVNFHYSNFRSINAINVNGDAIILENASDGAINYGDSNFDQIYTAASGDPNFANLRIITSALTPGYSRGYMAHCTFSHFETSADAGDLGIYTTSALDFLFNFVAMENLTRPISLGAAGGTTTGFKFNGGFLITTAGANTAITVGSNSGGNMVSNLKIVGDASTIPIADALAVGNSSANSYDIWLGTNVTPANITIAWPTNTTLITRSAALGTKTFIAGTVPPLIQGFQAMGSGIIASVLGCPDISSATGASTLADGQLRLMAIYIPYNTVVTGIGFNLGTQGVYTPDGYNGVALYSASGGTLTLRASSTNGAGTIWSQEADFYKVAFSSPYTATAGLYYVAALYNTSAETTAPILVARTAIFTTFSSFDFTNSNKISGTIAAQSALPTPTQALSGVTRSGALPFFFIY